MPTTAIDLKHTLLGATINAVEVMDELVTLTTNKGDVIKVRLGHKTVDESSQGADGGWYPTCVVFVNDKLVVKLC